jgi:enoyl-CoA hydratase
MSHIAIQRDDVLVSKTETLRRITLNRPQVMNALTLDMVGTMFELLRSWASDSEVGVVLLDGAGERGLCAGGDIRALYEAAQSGDDLPERFWRDEYRLDAFIARYPKPVVAVMDGVVMGGGVGLSAHASHRIVTERSAVAMPEAGIGFFPDVGVSFLLSRAPGYLGSHLALTGARIGATDAIYCGLADNQIPVARLANLPTALAGCRATDDVDNVLQKLSILPPRGEIVAAQPWIDRCYAADSIEDILQQLSRSEEDGAHHALKAIRLKSPTSLKVTLRNIREAATFESPEECMRQDYRIALACLTGHDFIEGIRAAVIDKDRKPRWDPAAVADVTADVVDRHFQPRGELELALRDY